MREWAWYKDQNTKGVFIELLLKCNHEEQKWLGINIKPGQCVIGRKQLAFDLGLSEQQIRTCLRKLEKSTGEITIKTTNKFSLITIVNYEKYQCTNQEINQEDDQQSTNNQPQTRTKELKNIKKKIIKEKMEKIIKFWNEIYPKEPGWKNTTVQNGQLMQKCLRVTEDIEKCFFEIAKKYTDKEISEAIKKYASDVCRRDPENSYAEHRFSFGEFLSQKNGFRKFITLVPHEPEPKQ